MKAFTLQQLGSLDGLVLGERPEPAATGPTDVVVRVRARSLNYRDLLILQQRYLVPPVAGVVPVSDGAGDVVAVGADVTRVAVGDRVAATYFPRWRDGRFAVALAAEQFGCTRDGMLAEAVVADEQALVKLPAHLSYAEAAALPCAGVTAWAAVNGPRTVAAFDTVLTIGTGGVALFALQFAKLAGARVVAVTSTAAKAQLLRELGADVAIASSEHPAWDQAVLAETGGVGVDHVVETGGPDSLPRSLACCRPEGDVALLAALGDVQLDARLLSAPVTLRRHYVGSRAHFEAMNAAIARHALRPVLDRTFALEDARAAYAHLEARRHVGKVVIADTV
ncbi:zinc containing alcohol dehydrogenase superfamily protein [Baekduia alba]|uniref:zinc-dependent alcohol dehydrogenase family protein n=1 Tax=Baekduia alba TaxID=2997333 RepID=UPI002341A04D|nr:NAD(P)-dependent alcohol dehydrogenase [Baekduia alba]WCB95159.1 zinc containing alcohol dehydrogenase superfamily protein [Baekduia alba]